MKLPAILLLASLAASPVFAQDFQNPDPSRYLFEDQIRPGMKGYGLTVMHGGVIEKFQVEVIDVVKNFGPGTNGLLVRCSGLGLEHSGIIAGMSGSPVFIDGKMIGAVAFGWGMAKDPIAGVQPIRNMLSIESDDSGRDTKVGDAGGGKVPARIEKMAANLPGWGKLVGALGRRTGHSPTESGAISMHALKSPLMVSGASSSTLAMLRHDLEGENLVPMASGSGGGGATGDATLGGLALLKPGEIKLEPGSAVAVPLVSGDLDMSAIGTVTEVRDGKVYAFGHAFMAEGKTKLPMSTGYIYTIMPNLQESFKMGTSLASAGTLVLDDQSAVMGVLGSPPPTIPMTVTVKDAGDGAAKSYHYQVAPYPRLLPELLNAALNETLVARRALPKQYTVNVTGHATFAGKDGEHKVTIFNAGSTEGFNPAMTVLPVAVLAENPFENLGVKEIQIDASIESVNKSGTIRGVTVDRLLAAPGDTIHAVVSIEPYQQDRVNVPLAIEIPKDAADGDYALSIGSSGMALMQEAMFAPQRYDPQNIGGLVATVDRILSYKPTTLYGTLVMNVMGATVDGREMKDLPASRVALYTSDRHSEGTPVFRIVRTTAETSWLVDGGESFSIHVDKDADKRYYEQKPSGMGMMRGGGMITLPSPPPSASKSPPSSEPSGPGD